MTGRNHKRRNRTSLFHFIIVVVYAKQTACLVNESSTVQPTMSEYNFPDMLVNFKPCGKDSPNCLTLCGICEDFFPEEMQKMECLFDLLHHLCLPKFHHDMNSTDWCDWGNVSVLYSNLSICTEEISECLPIPWPNPVVEQLFLDVHVRYFQDCPSEELNDPPPAIVFAFVITPICLIPVMVSLVVLKTKNGDGSP